MKLCSQPEECVGVRTTICEVKFIQIRLCFQMRCKIALTQRDNLTEMI